MAAVAAGRRRAPSSPSQTSGTTRRSQRVAELALERFGRIDVLVANAGIADQSRGRPTATRSAGEAVVETNLLGTLYAVRAVLPSMLDAARATSSSWPRSRAGKRTPARRSTSRASGAWSASRTRCGRKWPSRRPGHARRAGHRRHAAHAGQPGRAAAARGGRAAAPRGRRRGSHLRLPPARPRRGQRADVRPLRQGTPTFDPPA